VTTLRHNINRLDTLRRKIRKKPQSLHNAQRLKDSEAAVQQEILDTKANYEYLLILNFATNRDPKLFHHLKSMSKCDLLPPYIFSNTNKAECELDKAKLFNIYFHSVFTRSSLIYPI